MIWNLVLFLVMLFFLIKSSDYATSYASKLARSVHISEFLISFFIVAIISAFPETTVSVISAIEGVPELGLGTLIGSNVADLTLILGLVVLFSAKGNVETKISAENGEIISVKKPWWSFLASGI